MRRLRREFTHIDKEGNHGLKTILVGTDFSERSDRALQRAIRLAQKFKAGIMLVNVVDDDQPQRIIDIEREESERMLAQLSTTLTDVDKVPCDTNVILASPFVGLAKAVSEVCPDLLVIGSHRRQLLKDVFKGTTAERTIRSVSCPVLMVNDAAPTGDYRHVLQTTDLSEGSRDALMHFNALKIGEEAQNTLLYIFETPALRLTMRHVVPEQNRQRYLLDAQEAAADELEVFATSADLGEIRQIVRHETSSASLEILKLAQLEQADLIVMSTHRRAGITKLFIGSVTEKVLSSAPIDVLALPPAQNR